MQYPKLQGHWVVSTYTSTRSTLIPQVFVASSKFVFNEFIIHNLVIGLSFIYMCIEVFFLRSVYILITHCRSAHYLGAISAVKASSIHQRQG